jgi:1-acyl-sn-glycerol-3-phosphate acyltransferase
MKSIFIYIYNFFENRKTALWSILIALFAVFALLAIRISFEEDISKILNLDSKTRKNNSIVQSSKVVHKLIFIVSHKDTSTVDQEKLISFTDSLGVSLSRNTGALIKNISLKIEDDHLQSYYSIFLKNLPIFLEKEDYANFDSLFTKDSLEKNINANLQTLSTPLGVMSKYNLMYDPAGVGNNFFKRLRTLQTTSTLSTYNGYLFSKDSKHLVFYLEPLNASNETKQNGQLIDNIDKEIQNLSNHPSFKKLDCKYFGAAAVAVGNARQLRHDTILTLGLTGIFLFSLLFLVFRKRRISLLILLTVAFGGGFALAAIALIKTSISLIAIGAGSVILGIAVNYPIHLLSHNLHEKNIRNVIRDMVVPLTIGSATTIGGFLCLLFMKTELLRDLGLFGAFSLIGAALFTLIFFPHLIGDINRGKKTRSAEWLEKFGQISFEKKKLPLAIIFILTPVLFYFSFQVSFESDLTKLNYLPKHLKESESLLNQINGGQKQTIQAISYGNTKEEVITRLFSIKALTDSLTKNGTECQFQSPASILPPVHIQEQRAEMWNTYWTPERKESALKNLNKVGKELGFTPEAFDNFSQLLSNPVEILSSEDYNFLIDGFTNDLLSRKDSLYTLVSQIKVTPVNQDKVRSALTNLQGTATIDWKQMAERLLKIINDDFNLLFILTISLVFLALLLTYGRIELTLVTIIPMLVSWIWILGLMAVFGLKFNFVNIVLSTFIFGLGDDFCIFVMDGLQQQNKTGKKSFSSIRMGIYLSAITTIIGFGVLIFAQHPALRSLAFVSILGIISVLFISQTLEPYLFNRLITRQQQYHKPPLTISIILKSTFAFSYFVFGSLLLSAVGPTLMPFRLIAKKKSHYIYHWLLQKFVKSLLSIMSNVRKAYLNPYNENFSKPAIIISNHQSVLDILLLISIHPNIILLTNKWVWNSPVFGFVVRMAGYHPIVEGVETSIEKLSKAVDNGYSIAVFPEGTRTPDGKLQRFHKGAFYLAQELGLDIIPVLIHGTSRCLTKGSFVLRDETISYKILKRIEVNDATFGVTYQERAKQISRVFKAEHAKFSQEQETPHYYRNELISGYIYKGPILEWYLKVKIRLENDYQLFHELVPQKGVILDAGCGYGFLSHMLSFLSSERNIRGIDYDEEKIEVANNVFYKKPHVSFAAADLETYEVQPSDCIIISDVLHYLSQNGRVRFLLNCFAQLNEGGSIIIRDADQSKEKRHKGSVLTEIFSTKIFRFNKTQNSLTFFSSAEIIELATKNGLQARIIDNTKLTSNILIVLNKNK